MNRLADSHSPYLLQHADNPVDWWPWSDAAFAEARRRDVPVLLSIGYATCHWCHVMAHESFEDAATAQVLNRAFVCVKVDREERPDVDGLYMAACLAARGHGGWPLTALLLPDTREPFWVGTYLPRATRGGRMGVTDLAENVAAFWTERPDGVRDSASELAGAVRQMAEAPAEGEALGEADLDRAADALLARADPQHGGFGLAPKFPTPHLVALAVALAERDARAGRDRADALAVVAGAALDAMAAGGLNDHLAGGFHRYSTDRTWLLPHFEKTLYDQAGLALAYLRPGERDGPWAETARRTLGYVLDRLRAPDGTFYSGEDADTLLPDGHSEEGATYVWSPSELDAVLGEEVGALAARLWDVRPGGNFLDEATRQPTGASVLHRRHGTRQEREVVTSRLAAHGLTVDGVAARLLAARDVRPQPALDDKRLTDWNGLVIAALARAGEALDEPRFIAAAERAAERLLDLMGTPDGGLWHRAHRDAVGISGLLDDYAFLAWGLTDLYRATLDTPWLTAALRLHGEATRRFGRAGGGVWSTAEGADDLFVRRVDLDDGAIPSGYSAHVWNGLRLARLTGRSELEDAAWAALRVPAAVREHPTGFGHLYAALAYALAPSREIVVVGQREAPDTSALLQVVRRHAGPDDAVLLVTPGDAAIREAAPFAAALADASDRPQVFVCRDHACALPTSDPADLAATMHA